MTKSRSDTASSEFAIGRAHVAVDRERSAGKGRRSQRHVVHPLLCIGEAPAVPCRHLDIGQKMMTERHRLRALQMRETRHHRAGVLERLLGQCPLIVGEQPVDVVDARPYPKPEIGRDLVVARARRVQPPGRGPDQTGQPALDVHMDIFERAIELELARADL
jgi:hypothetical protein